MKIYYQERDMKDIKKKHESFVTRVENKVYYTNILVLCLQIEKNSMYKKFFFNSYTTLVLINKKKKKRLITAFKY